MAKNNQKKEKAARNRENAMKYRKKTASKRGGPRRPGPSQSQGQGPAPSQGQQAPAQAPTQQAPAGS
ncbi:MAG: hypothetical protein VKJ04_10710 [Vampirovibrionales bacterium]|nr:hypothetical protein [Vampirovibrionales bacterium]